MASQEPSLLVSLRSSRQRGDGSDVGLGVSWALPLFVEDVRGIGEYCRGVHRCPCPEDSVGQASMNADSDSSVTDPSKAGAVW